MSADEPVFDDLLYTKTDGVAVITINRPDKLNAFRGQTCDELVRAFQDAWADRTIGAVILTGAGDRAFCTGGDVSVRDESGHGRGGGRADKRPPSRKTRPAPPR